MRQLPAPSRQLQRLCQQSAIRTHNRQSTLTKSAVSNRHLLDPLSCNLFDGRDTVHHFVQTAPAQRDHSFFDRLAPQLETRGADENEFTELLPDFHHLVKADAALVAGVVALLAAGALLRNYL